MDISQYVVGAEGIDALSAYQISNFFRLHQSFTKDDCDSMAGRIIGCSVTPTLVQGQTSYTVEAASADRPSAAKVVQFRRSPLSLDMMEQARQTYTGFVPSCNAAGTLGDVYVYEMDLVTGLAFSRARHPLFGCLSEQRPARTVQDLARFAAKGRPPPGHVPVPC